MSMTNLPFRDRNLSRRAQTIAVAAVLGVFGGGWLMVWKLAHIQFRYRMARLDPAVRATINTKVTDIPLPGDAPPDWVRFDLGVCRVALPGRVRSVGQSDATGVRIETDQCDLWAADLLVGQRMAEQGAREGWPGELRGERTWSGLSHLAYLVSACRTTEADFSWWHSVSEVWALEQRLAVKALEPPARIARTRSFRTADLLGLLVDEAGDGPSATTVPSPDRSSGYGCIQAASIITDGVVVLYVRSPGGGLILPDVAGSIRFAPRAADWDAAAVRRRIETLVNEFGGATSRPVE